MTRPKLTPEDRKARRLAGMQAAQERRASLTDNDNLDAWTPRMPKHLSDVWAEALANAPKPAELADLSMMEAYEKLGILQYEEDKKGKRKLKPGKGYIVDPRLVNNLFMLHLDGIDYAIIMRIQWHHWDWSRPPFVALSRIAASLGVTTATVRQRIRRMEALGYVRVIKKERPDGTDASNAYDFRPLLYVQSALEDESTPAGQKVWDRKVRRMKGAGRFGHQASHRTPLPPEEVPPSPRGSTPFTGGKGDPSRGGRGTLHVEEALEVDPLEVDPVTRSH